MASPLPIIALGGLAVWLLARSSSERATTPSVQSVKEESSKKEPQTPAGEVPPPKEESPSPVAKAPTVQPVSFDKLGSNLATAGICSSYAKKVTVQTKFQFATTSVKWLSGGLIGNTVMRVVNDPSATLDVAKEVLRMLKDESSGFRSAGILGGRVDDLEALTRCYEKWMMSKLRYNPSVLGAGEAPDLSSGVYEPGTGGVVSDKL